MEDEHPDLKFITNTGAHDIIKKKYNTSLQQQIILALSAVDWTSIDVVRISTNDTCLPKLGPPNPLPPPSLPFSPGSYKAQFTFLNKFPFRLLISRE